MVVMKQVAPGVQLRFHRDRDPNLGSYPRLAPLKRGWRYPHDGVGVLVDINGLVDDIGVRTKMRLPKPVADHRHRRASRLLILHRKKTAPKDRPHTQYIEITRGRYHTKDALWLALTREAHLRKAARRDACETLLPVAHGFQIRIGKRERGVSGLAQGQRHNLARVTKPGNGIEQRGVDPAENRGVRSDSERKRQDGKSRKPRCLRDHPQAIPYISPERGHSRTPQTQLRMTRSMFSPILDARLIR